VAANAARLLRSYLLRAVASAIERTRCKVQAHRTLQIPTMIRQCGISGSSNRVFSGFREFLHTEVVLAG
jgi:hypothetical protein